MQTTPTPTAYLNSIPEPQRSELKTLHALIRKHAPKHKPYMQECGANPILGYGKHKYETKSGCSGEWFLMGLANRKNYLAFYTVASDGKKYLAEEYTKKLPKANIGKSCIRFKKLEDINLKVIEEIIKESVKRGIPDWLNM